MSNKYISIKESKKHFTLNAKSPEFKPSRKYFSKKMGNSDIPPLKERKNLSINTNEIPPLLKFKNNKRNNSPKKVSFKDIVCLKNDNKLFCLTSKEIQFLNQLNTQQYSHEDLKFLSLTDECAFMCISKII